MEHTRYDDHPFDEFSETVDENYLISIAEVKANLAEPELQGSYSFSDFAFPGVNGPKYDELFMPDKAWFEWRMKEQRCNFFLPFLLVVAFDQFHDNEIFREEFGC